MAGKKSGNGDHKHMMPGGMPMKDKDMPHKGPMPKKMPRKGR